MPDIVEVAKVRDFSSKMIGSYERRSILGRVTEAVEYRRQEVEFFQIGKRVLLPMEFFSPEDNYINDPLAGEFAHSVVIAEQKYLLHEIDRLTDENAIPSQQLDGFSYEGILEASNSMTAGATDVFMPIDMLYFSEVHNWLSRGIAVLHDARDGGLSIRLANGNARVHWSSKAMPLRDIYIINRLGITAIRKRFEDIAVPSSLVNVQHSFEAGRFLRLDFALSQRPDNFDFYFRSVINLSIQTRSALRIMLPDVPRNRASSGQRSRCPTCNGTGAIRPDNPEGSSAMVVCPMCGGSGRI